MKRKIFSVLAVFALISQVCLAQGYYDDPLDDSARMANRRTALRCLSLAKNCAAKNDWSSVVTQISMGLTYDDTVSDLWYMLAVAENNLGKTKSVVGSYVERAINEQTWLDYNRDAARILYADILCDTGRYADVAAVLDGNGRDFNNPAFVNGPYVYSSDAEYIRAKSYYRLGEPDLARTKIDAARKLYPNDIRFPLLFFTYENPQVANNEVSRIARLFINQILEYSGGYFDGSSASALTELEVLAIPFADAKTRTVMIKSFKARGLKHPRFALVSLQNKLMTETQALDYIMDFADSVISYEDLIAFLSALTEDGVKKSAASYLNAYNGSITKDTDGDKLVNLYVQYQRGRPQTIYYDKNQDGSYEWSANCDFGNPVSGAVYSQGMDFTWGKFPAVRTVSIHDAKGQVTESYRLVAGGLNWSPFNMTVDFDIRKAAGISFYFPILNDDVDSEKGIPASALMNASSSVTVKSGERENATVTFSVLSGKVQSAIYAQGNVQYAMAQFENGNPVLRSVDCDGDGIFETTEFYGIDKNGEMEVHGLEDERIIMQNLFGVPSNAAPYYLRMIQVDTHNKDAIPDFTEEYLPRGGKITSWDTDSDGSWDIRYVRKSAPKGSSNAPVQEETMFFDNDSNLVHVAFENGVPVSVYTAIEKFTISEDDTYRFYWIGEKGSLSLTRLALQALNANAKNGGSVMVSDKAHRVLAVWIGEQNFGMIIED
ncbi:MAG: hypothetical protein IIU46_06895 [Treponema sp.]|nr:hypothetical protein [Treponema sp.]